MSMVRVATFADDGRLVDTDLVDFLRKKVDKGQKLDLSGITEVAGAVFDALWEGMTPEQVADLIGATSDASDAALAAWVDRRASAVKRAERVPRVVRVRRPSPPVSVAPAVARPPTDDTRFTPTRLARRLQRTLRSYIESAYPLSDPTLVRARRRLLEEEAGGHLLAQEPYIETTTRYAMATESYGDLGLPPHIAGFLSDLARAASSQSTPDDSRTILYSTLYEHQAESFREYFVAGHDVVVATGTGSGKTECFLVPMLGTLFDEAHERPESFARPGVRALVLYPMNALVNDQLGRLRLLLGDPSTAAAFKALGKGGRAPRFGMYTGRTPYPGPRKPARDRERVQPLLEYYLGLEPDIETRLRRMGRYPAKDLRAFFAAKEVRQVVTKTGKRKGQLRTQYHWKRRLHTGPDDSELLTRQEMVHGSGTLPGHAPDVLVTNYSMLEYMLMRPFERPIFAETRRWLAQDGAQLLLVLDEAHMYRGAKGAEVAFLIRRLRARLGIHDSPEKLRVIATSASLGGTEEARETVRRFAADMSGKRPEDFVAVTGTREVPEPAAPGTFAEADMLASLDLDAIHGAANGAALGDALAALVPVHADGSERSEDKVLAELYEVLENKLYVNQLIQEAAGRARALTELAECVFPGHPRSLEALEGLLTVGTLARRGADAPGLIPTRVHGVFRGLHGLYACINPTCGGRQSEHGQQALLGKLFVSPRVSCDTCGSRVFEIASCRSCGSPYLLAYSQESGLDRLTFLWGETEGALYRIELLPSPPRYEDCTEEARIHLATGFVDVGNRFPDTETRSLYFAWSHDEGRHATFPRCAMCQPDAHSKSRIYNFRTRGEQPFTALIEAQFAEQPPQKHEAGLPNHGRKVLVFSDGRQKAARLAPALEHSHARDLFRQALALAAHELQATVGGAPMTRLYAGIVHLCASRGYDLFPSSEEVEFHNHVGACKELDLDATIARSNAGWLNPTASFGQALFSEFTDRYYSLQSLALASIEEDPTIRSMLFDDFPEVGLDEVAVRVLFRGWIAQHLERRSFRPPGARLDDLGEGWAVPVGINAARVEHILPNRFGQYIERILEDDGDAVTLVQEWFRDLVRRKGLLHFEGDLYYLQLLGLRLNLRIEAPWLRCVDCGRIHAETLSDTCPACLGRVVDADADYLDARTGFYREQLRRAFDPRALEPFGLSAAEHSAQLTATPDDRAFNKVEEYELRFQDIRLDGKAPIDVLSCTTTMEVGIDIGALTGVALRNVPPQVANYQQRSGRAGRRGRSIASVITYAHGTSHDAHYFEHPDQIISGAVRAPIVYVENQQVLERHIQAYLVQRFFHEHVPADPTSYDLFGSLGTVEQFLSGAHAISLTALERWLDANASTLRGELLGWVPSFTFGLGEPIDHVEMTIAGAVDETKRRIREVLPVEAYAQREQLPPLEEGSLVRLLEEQLLEMLIAHAVFPRYAFPTDVVAFWVAKARAPGDPPWKRVFDYEPQRDLQLALTEYAPGRSLTIDKYRFTAAALYSPYEPSPGPTLDRSQPYTSCKDCSWATMEPQAAASVLCPVCGGDQLTRMAFITPAGFAPDINERREVDAGQSIAYAGMTDRARLEPQDPPDAWTAMYDGRILQWTGSRRLVMVNKGVGERGFRVCRTCGRSEPEYGPGFTTTRLTKGGTPTSHKHPLEKGVVCSDAAEGPFYLGHTFPTDALLLRVRVASPVALGAPTLPGLLSRAAKMALTSMVEAIGLAASRTLQIDEGELSGWWTPVLGNDANVAQLYLYDLLPGGAGYARAVGEAIDEVLDEAEAFLGRCDCSSSCYRCLRHYANNWIHASLDRHLALALIRYLRGGVVPVVTTEEKASALAGLRELLAVRGIPHEVGHLLGTTRVPLIVHLPSGDLCVDVHHPLVDPIGAPSEVVFAGQGEFLETLSLDAFELLHDLPSAFRRLNLPDGSTP